MSSAYLEDPRPDKKGNLYPFYCYTAAGWGKQIIVDPHWHYQMELLYFIKGTVKVLVGGQWFQAEPGDFILINSCEVHAVYISDGANTQYIVLQFDTDLLYSVPKTFYETAYLTGFTVANSFCQKFYSAGDMASSPVPDIMKEILDEYENGGFAFEFAIRNSICKIVLWVLRHHNKQGGEVFGDRHQSRMSINTLNKVFEFVDRSYDQQISAEAAAQMCNFSYSYFSTEFKKATGKSFKEYLNFIRITEGEKLLLNTNKSITEIAQNIGYTSSSYFIEQFKRIKKISPKQYRKSISHSWE